MKLTKSFEQGVCLMAILATQAKALPVSSRTLQRAQHLLALSH